MFKGSFPCVGWEMHPVCSFLVHVWNMLLWAGKQLPRCFSTRLISSAQVGRSGYAGALRKAGAWGTQRDAVARAGSDSGVPPGVEQRCASPHGFVLPGEVTNLEELQLRQDPCFLCLFLCWDPFLMLMIPIFTPAQSHRMKLARWNGRLILWFGLCICHSLPPSP